LQTLTSPQRNGSMSSPHHASIPAWAWAVPLLASALVALKLADIAPSDDTYVLVLAGLFLGATVFAAVHHAEVLALKLGEPFGSILLAVAVTVRSRAHCLDHACRRRGQRARRSGHRVCGRDDRSQWRRRSLPRSRGRQALRADLPTSGRSLRARGAGHFGHAGVDPAQLRRGCFGPILFHSAVRGHRPYVAGPLVRLCLRANRQAS
jgi:hypothetical protein